MQNHTPGDKLAAHSWMTHQTTVGLSSAVSFGRRRLYSCQAFVHAGPRSEVEVGSESFRTFTWKYLDYPNSQPVEL
jgi:hypothetical protein